MTQTQNASSPARARPVGYQQDFEFTVAVATIYDGGEHYNVATVDYMNADGAPFLREQFGSNDFSQGERFKNRLFLQAELNSKGDYEGAYKEYDRRNGFLVIDATKNAAGNFEGVRKTYHKDGSISGIITTNAEGRENGLWASYFENGEIYKKCMRRNGDKYGFYLFGNGKRPHHVVGYEQRDRGPALNLFPSINEVIEDSRVAAENATKASTAKPKASVK